jgi:site-specific recombinase XerD
MTDLISSDSATLAAQLQATADRATDYRAKAKAANTIAAYRADWHDFTTWCTRRNLESLPATPATVTLYITDLAERCKPSTITRHLATISQAHQQAGHATPTSAPIVRDVLQGIKREKGTAPAAKAAAVTAIIRTMIETLDDDLKGKRDRALILIGFAGAFRRSELVGLTVAMVQFTNDGVVVRLPHSKTDQEGLGENKGIPYGSTPATCPVRALRGWLDAVGIVEGPIFRPINRWGQVQPRQLTDHAVAVIVKQQAAQAGYDPATFSGHSLRAGLATAAAAAGAPYHAIKKQTGHRSDQMLQRYIRDGSLFRENAAAKVGL